VRVLVTGGLGFMGSNFVTLLLRETDWEVQIVDGVSYATNPLTADFLRAVARQRKRKLKIHFCRIQQFLEAYPNAFADLIIHFAAMSHVDRSWMYPREALENNMKETERLLSRTNFSYFVHISTDEVYGPSHDGIAFQETDQFAPTSPYAITKAVAEYLVQIRMMTDSKWKYLIVRPTNCYGFFQCPEKLIPFSITNLLLGKKIKLYGDGTQRRTWFWIEDCCHILLQLIQREVTGILNIGPPLEDRYHLMNREVAELILYHMRLGPEDYLEYIEDRPRHDIEYLIDTSKLYRIIDHECIPPKRGIKKTVTWYRNHEKWWRKSRERLQSWYQVWYGERL